MQAAVGISIGACNSSVAVFKDGVASILQNERGDNLTPSITSFIEGNAFVCGHEAFEKLEINPEATIYDVKRLIGRYEDEGDAVLGHVRYWPFTVTSENGRFLYYVSHRGEHMLIYPEQIMATLIYRMKSIAEAYLEETVTHAVLTVPATFGTSQRLAIKYAAMIAGLRDVHLVNETTAVVLAYVVEHRMPEPWNNEKQEVMVCSMGAGSSDFSSFTLKNTKIETRATSGCDSLGGIDFTNSINGFLAEEIRVKEKKTIYDDRRAVMRLRNEAERVKKELGMRPRSNIRLDNLLEGLDYRSSMNRNVFEQILYTDSRIRNEIRFCDRNTQADLEEILFVGGTSRIPYFRNLVRDVTSIQPDTSLHAEDTAVIGAAIKAANISGASANVLGALEITDVAPMTIKMLSGPEMDKLIQTIIRQNDPVPCEMEQFLRVPNEPRPEIFFKMYEGDHLVPSTNRYLGEVHIKLQEGQYKTEDKVRVCFVIDDSGILDIPFIELVPDKKSVDFSFTRPSLSVEDVERLTARFPTLGVAR